MDLAEAFRAFRPVSLDDLDKHAPLLKRIDNKYALELASLPQFAERLRADHDVLEIGGGRAFAYSSVYFDTQGLRCFHDHVDDVHPRFKARTRYYRDSDRCVFEVKLKTGGGETDKRQIDYPPEERERVTDDADRFLRAALGDVGLELDDRLDASLHTDFERATLAARNDTARVTIDSNVRLSRPDGRERRLRPGLVVIETKSEDGESAADAVLAELGVDQISFSKYKLGIALLTARKLRDKDDRRTESLFE